MQPTNQPTNQPSCPSHPNRQTPENKPTSVTTIISFATPDAVKALFGGALKEAVDISLWRKRTFQKSYKSDSGKATFKRVGESSSWVAGAAVLWQSRVIDAPLLSVRHKTKKK